MSPVTEPSPPLRPVTVALIGPDGAGKTTIARRLAQDPALKITYIYMGISPDASTHLLPTTRMVRALKHTWGIAADAGGPPDSRVVRARPRGIPRRLAASVRALLRLVNHLAEEWTRQAIVWSRLRRGWIVVFDRHFLADFHAFDVTRGSAQPLSRRIHGYLLAHAYPKPDLVVYLDAPAEVLFERKREGSVELLERRRQEYLQLAPLTRHFLAVDAARPIETVTRDVTEVIRRFAATDGPPSPGSRRA